MTLQNRVFTTSAVIVSAAIVALITFTTLASAAVSPTATLTIQNGSNATVTTVPVGTGVHASVVVASSSTSTLPTGTVDFNLYNGNQTCSNSSLAQTGVPLVNGAAISSTTTVPIGGLSYRVTYNGQSDLNAATTSNCVAVAATQASTALSLSLSNTNVLAGSFVYAIPNLTGETAGADGNVAYKVYSNNSCTNLALDASNKTVTDGSTPNSDSYQFITAGTYYWQGVYSGDADNAIATSTCNAAGTILTVTPTTTPPTTPGTISGTVFNDLNKDDDQDAGEPGLSSWTVWLHKAASTTNNNWLNKLKKHDFYDDPIVATATTDANGNYSFPNLGEGTYFVEESVKAGWKQTSDDVKVVLNANKTSADVDFSNIEKKTNNGNGNGNNGTSTKDHDDNGNHNGWFGIWGRWGNWFNR